MEAKLWYQSARRWLRKWSGIRNIDNSTEDFGEYEQPYVANQR